MSINCIHEIGANAQIDADLIAVHGAFEDPVTTWTDSKYRLVWLTELLDIESLKLRVLEYRYKAHTAETPQEGSADRILPLAKTFLQAICAERDTSQAKQRPLIFLCHDIGGILVKKALSLSSQKRRERQDRSVYLSTVAILFYGTPHLGIDHLAKHHTLRRLVKTGPSQLLRSLERGSETLQNIEDEFAPLLYRYRIHCFWETEKTTIDGQALYIVEQDSAAPPWENAETTGIPANHSSMCKYTSTSDLGFKLSVSAINQALAAACTTVSTRWHIDSIGRERRTSFTEDPSLLLAPLRRASSELRSRSRSPSSRNQHFLVEKSSSPLFTGQRQVLQSMKNALILQDDVGEGGSSRRIFVLHGMGGSGKTELCLKFVEEHRAHFWGIFWIVAKTETDADEGFARIGRHACLAEKSSAGLHWLSQQTQPWLLVLDNADDVTMDLSNYFPAGGMGSIIITTQNPSNTIHKTVGEYRIRGMEPDDAVNFLLNASRDPSETSPSSAEIADRHRLAQQIVQALGYLALAIKGAATTIKKKLSTLEAYLAFFRPQRRHIKQRTFTKSGETLQDDYVTIITTWEGPLTRISEMRSLKHADAIDLLYVFSCMHFEQIPQSLFTRAWSQSRSGASNMPVASSSLVNFQGLFGRRFTDSEPRLFSDETNGPLFNHHRRLREAISVLHEHSLIEYDAKTATCALHPVVHRWARERLDADKQKTWLSITTRLIAASIFETPEASGQAHRRLLLPHINTVLQLWKLHFHQITQDAALTAVALKFAGVLHEFGYWHQARDLQQSTVSFYKMHARTNDPSYLKALESLSHTCWDLFETGLAQRAREELHNQSVHLFGAQHRSSLHALDLLANVYWLTSQYDNSLKCSQEATQGLQDSFGYADPIVLQAKFNLARTLMHLGRHAEAMKQLKVVRNKFRHFFGPRHPDTIAAAQQLGMVFHSLRRFEEAETLISEVVELRVAMLGRAHAYTLWALNDLAKIICSRGDAQRSWQMLKDVEFIAIQTLGAQHVGTSMTRTNLVRALMELQRLDEAELLLQELMSVLPKDHNDRRHCEQQIDRVKKLRAQAADRQPPALERATPERRLWRGSTAFVNQQFT